MSKDDFSKISVLMVDDESLMLSVLGSICSELGIKNIHKAYNAKQAMQFHSQNEINITFLDIEMPDQNGIQTLKQIKEANDKRYVVMLSGNGTLDNVKGAQDAGANGFIVKPYSTQKIVKALKQYQAHVSENN